MKINEAIPLHQKTIKKDNTSQNDPYGIDVRIDSIAQNARQVSSHTVSLCGSTCSQSACSSRTCDGGSAC